MKNGRAISCSLKYTQYTDKIMENNTPTYAYKEILAEIALIAGYYNLRMNNDSRVVISTLILWADEFEKKHKNTDWSETDYPETIQNFCDEKFKPHVITIDHKCPQCASNTFVVEKYSAQTGLGSAWCINCAYSYSHNQTMELIKSHGKLE